MIVRSKNSVLSKIARLCTFAAARANSTTWMIAWVASRSNFLVHVNVLARLFRGKMLAMLMAAHDAGQLKFFNSHAGLADKRTFKRFIAPLRWLKHEGPATIGGTLAPHGAPCS